VHDDGRGRATCDLRESSMTRQVPWRRCRAACALQLHLKNRASEDDRHLLLPAGATHCQSLAAEAEAWGAHEPRSRAAGGPEL
jgi:hypothetical protein